MGGILGLCELALLVTPFPKLKWFFGIIMAVMHECLVAALMFFALLLLWTIAMPPWIERLFLHVRRHLYLAVAVALVPLAIAMVLGMFGIKLGSGLEP
jgi:hypothetical protein